MTDVVDIEKIMATIGQRPVESVNPPSEEAVVEEMINTTAARFFKGVENPRANKKPIFVGYFEAGDVIHEKARIDLLAAAEWLCTQSGSDCIWLSEPREYSDLVNSPQGGGRFEFRGLLVDLGPDANELVEQRLVRDDEVQSYTYYIFGPDLLPSPGN